MKSIIDEALAKYELKKTQDIIKFEETTNDNPDDEELKKLIETLKINVKIIGCGSSGSNTINRLNETGIVGAQMMAINTDATHLLHVHAPKKMLISKWATKDPSIGALPWIGEHVSRENEDEIRAYLKDAHIVFVTAGMGSEFGADSAPVVARIAKEVGALVMGVVTMPFHAEGHIRVDNAIKSLNKLNKYCDTTIVIKNDKLLELVPRLPLDAAFKVGNEILMNSIKGITEIITKPGLVNIDFDDIMTVMGNGGVAVMGMGASDDDDDRVDIAINEALNSPLLGDFDASHAKGALVRIVGGQSMTIQEAQYAIEIISKKIRPSARIIWGCTVDPTLEKDFNVLLVITGVKHPPLILSENTPRVFLSYDNSDNQIARKVTEQLRKSGVQVHFSSYEFTVENSFFDVFKNAISTSDYILILLSSHSVNSKWFRYELAEYIHEYETRDIEILPVIVDDCIIPAPLANKQWIDLRSDFTTSIEKITRQIQALSNLNFSCLDDLTFESLVKDLLNEMGFKIIKKEIKSLNYVIDMQAEKKKTDSEGKKRNEMWFIEAKFYHKERVNLKTLNQLITYNSTLSNPSNILIVTNGQLTSPTRDWLIKSQSIYKFEIRVIEGPELKQLLILHSKLIDKYFKSRRHK